MTFIEYPIDVDHARIRAAMLADWTSRGYAADAADPATALIEVFALRHAQTRQLLVQVGEVIFREFGQQVHALEPTAEVAAQAAATITVADTDGYTVPAGLRFSYPVDGTTSVLLTLVDDVEITAGSTTGSGVVEATVAGTAANGLTALTLDLIDRPAYLTSVATTATLSGGVDAETDAEYVERLSNALTLYSRIPRLAGEYALAALQQSTVYRARDIPGYDYDTLTPDTPGHVTVAVTDEDGAALSAGDMTDVETALTSDDARALNVVVHVIAPQQFAVTVDFDAVAKPGADAATVESAAIAAVEAFLDPATWQWRADGTWGDETTIRHQDVSAILSNVVGLDYWTTLTLNGGTADLDMSSAGIAPLPDPTVTGDVT